MKPRSKPVNGSEPTVEEGSVPPPPLNWWLVSSYWSAVTADPEPVDS
jgi:hypothetical protein